MTPPTAEQVPTEVSPAPTDRRTATTRPAGWIRRLLPFLRPYRRNVALAFGGALVGSAIAALTPVVERQLVDNVILHHRSPLWPWLLLLVAAGVARFGAAYVRRYPPRIVGSRVPEALWWVPAEELEEFNRHIVGLIEIVAKFERSAVMSG